MVDVAPIYSLPYLAQGINKPEEPKPGFEDLMGAAFRSENEIVSATRWMTQPTFEIDTSFNLGEALDTSAYSLDYSETLAQAQSQLEFTAIEDRIKSEQADRATLAAGGFGGIIAAMGAGLLSPTTLVPLTGGAKGVKGVAQSFALAGAAISAQEAVLFGTQDTRTPEEVMIGIAAGTVLGGLMGSAAVFMRKADFDAAALDMGSSYPKGAMSYPSGVHADGTLRTSEPMPIVRDMPEVEFTIPAKRGNIELSPVRHIDELRIPAPSQLSVIELADIQTKSVAAAQEAVANGIDTGSVARMTDGPVTMTLGRGSDDTAVYMLVDELQKLKGVDEVEIAGATRVEVTQPQVRPNSFDADADAVKIRVNHLGEAYLVGNPTRVADAGANGSKAIRAEIEWVNGAQQSQGKWHPNEVIQRAYQKTDDLAAIDAKANEIDFAAAKTAQGQSTAGAKAAPTGRAQQLKRAGVIRGWVNDQFSKLNPVTRNIKQTDSATASYHTTRLSDAGLKTTENVSGVAHAKGGTAEARISSYDNVIAKALKDYHAAYGEHLSKGATAAEDKQISAFMANLRSGIQTTSGGLLPTLPPGKLTVQEFDELVFDLGNTGAKHSDSAVMKAVAAQRAFFDEYKFRINEAYDHLKKVNGDDPNLRPMIDTEGSLGPDVHEYINHLYDTDKIIAESGPFKEMLQNHSLEIMNRNFAKAHGKYKVDMANLERQVEEAVMTSAQRANVYKTLGEEADALRVDPVFVKQAEVEDGLRAQWIATGGTDPELEAAIKSAMGDASIEYSVIKSRLDVIETRRKWLDETEFDADTSKALRRSAYELEDGFDTAWRAKGATGGNLALGKADFAERALEDSEALFSRITGARGRVAGMDILGAERGPELARVLNLPFKAKKNFLIRNPEQLMRIFGRQVAADIEIYRISGSVNGAKMFDDIAADFTNLRTRTEQATEFIKKPARVDAEGNEITPAVTVPMTSALRAKELTRIAKSEKQVVTDMTVQIERLRHQRGVPDDANSIGYRAGRAALSINVFRNMGMVAVSSIPDVGRPVMKMGLMNTFQHAWAPLVTDLKRVKMGRALANELGIALDPVLHNRSRAVFDVLDNLSSGQQTKIERGIEFLANKTGYVAGFDRWTAEQKYLAASVGMSVFSKHLRTLATGAGSAKQLAEAAETLAAHGIELDDAQAIWKQFLSKNGSTEFAEGVRLPNMESWTDYSSMSTYRAAINKFVDDTIVTPGLDRPNWVDANMGGRLIAQFRSFTFTSTNRTVMAGLQDTDMALVNGMAISLVTGALSYYLWAVATGGSAYENMLTASEGEWADQAIARSGLLGVIAEPWSVLQRIPGLSDKVTFGGAIVKNRQGRTLMGAVAGPSFDLGEKLLSLVLSMNNPTKADLHKVRQLSAYQNVYWLRRALNAVEDAAGDFVGLPERRGN